MLILPEHHHLFLRLSTAYSFLGHPFFLLAEGEKYEDVAATDMVVLRDTGRTHAGACVRCPDVKLVVVVEAVAVDCDVERSRGVHSRWMVVDGRRAAVCSTVWSQGCVRCGGRLGYLAACSTCQSPIS